MTYDLIVIRSLVEDLPMASGAGLRRVESEVSVAMQNKVSAFMMIYGDALVKAQGATAGKATGAKGPKAQGATAGKATGATGATA